MKNMHNNFFSKIRTAALICVLLCIAIFSSAVALAENDTVTVYVAGNPNLYPIEYYDESTKSFKGVIPDILEEYSQKGTYQIEYLDTKKEDVRKQKAENLQAELISGCVQAEFSEQMWQDGIVAFELMCDGINVQYRILFTEIADENLKGSLKEYFAGITASKINTFLVEEAANKKTSLSFGMTIGIIVFSFAFLILLVGAAMYIKKKLFNSMKYKIDPVTGIGNDRYLAEHYGQYVHDKNRILYCAVCFHVNTEKFRRIKGSKETDRFLRFFAAIINEYITVTDIFARVSDGDFAVFKLSEISEKSVKFVEIILNRLKEYNDDGIKEYSEYVSAGLYQLRNDDKDFNMILLKCEQAYTYAYTHGLLYTWCTKEISFAYEGEKELYDHFDTAINNNEFVLYLHFFVDTVSDAIVGAEALSRWNHPQKGLIFPSKYIPLLEKENSVEKLDYYMLNKVCEFLQRRYREKKKDFFVSCNFSRSTFVDKAFADKCIAIIENYEFPREALILELTESAAIIDNDTMYENARKMKEYGTSIALDDFGSGSASFFDLEKYRFDGLKIDKNLVEELSTKEGQIILKGLVDIGHKLNMTVLAEGAETKEQVDKLAQINCDVIQGFYFYKPMPEYEAEKYIEKICV